MEVTILALFHLVIVNTLFIALDYGILKRITKTEVSLLIIVLGGFTSLFLGVYLTNHIIDYYFQDQWIGFKKGYVKQSLFISGAAIFIVCSALIELPFCILAPQKKNLVASFKGVVISNLVTNIPVGLLYYFSGMYYSAD
jgi:hypothetical protein